MTAPPVHTFRHHAMAALFEVRISGEEEAFAAGAAHEAFAEADRMEALLSRFLPDSEIAAISRLAPGESFQLSGPTAACLAFAIEMERATSGAFSIHATALRHGGSRPQWELDARRIHVLSGTCHFDLGAVGKGFALDRMAALLREWGASSFLLISGGSSVLAGEAPMGSDGWPVSVGGDRTPIDLSLTGRSLGASGLSVKGDHITDPRTGQPAKARERAWVLAHSAAESDALSTACMVLNNREIQALAAARPDITIWVASPDGFNRFGNAPDPWLRTPRRLFDNLLDEPAGDASVSFMNSSAVNDLEFVQVKALALAVSDPERAKRFYGETLGLPPDDIHHMGMAFMIGNVFLLLKPQEEWYGKPAAELNARITLEVKDAYATEKALLARGVAISDPVAVYDDNPVGAFLDSEGNKLWFCSESTKG